VNYIWIRKCKPSFTAFRALETCWFSNLETGWAWLNIWGDRFNFSRYAFKTQYCVNGWLHLIQLKLL